MFFRSSARTRMTGPRLHVTPFYCSMAATYSERMAIRLTPHSKAGILPFPLEPAARHAAGATPAANTSWLRRRRRRVTRRVRSGMRDGGNRDLAGGYAFRRPRPDAYGPSPASTDHDPIGTARGHPTDYLRRRRQLAETPEADKPHRHSTSLDHSRPVMECMIAQLARQIADLDHQIAAMIAANQPLRGRAQWPPGDSPRRPARCRSPLQRVA
jgi:hypothetical protein